MNIKINQAKEKIQVEAETLNTPFTDMMARQISEMITSSAHAEAILQDDKTLKGCKAAFDKFASNHKTGNQSVITPEDAEKLICDYFGFPSSGIENIKKEAKSEMIDVTDLL